LISLLLVVASASAPALATEYPDVPKWHWAWDYVQGVTDAQIAAGYDDGLYRPSVVVSRDQMAVFIARAMCGGDPYVPPGPPEASFDDVPNTGHGESGTDPYWAYTHIEYAVAESITKGYEDGLYHPEWNVTRGQMAVFIARAMCGGDDYVPAAPGSPTFPDVTSEGENAWCYQHVEYVADQGVTLGYPDGLYHPEIACSRDQMAAYLCRSFDLPTPPRPYHITEHFPLGGGDTWTYESSEGVYSSTVSGTEELWGTLYARVVSSEDDEVDYWLGQPEGLYLGGFYSPEDGTISFNPPLLIDNGLEPGDSGSQSSEAWLDQRTLVGSVDFEYAFVGPQTTSVPAGTFEDCMKLRIRVQVDGDVDEFYVWAARGVGVVKRDSGAFGGEEWEVLIAGQIGGTQYPAESGPFALAYYWPLDVGNTWVYESAEGTVVSQITGVDEIGGVEAARLSDGAAVEEPDRDYFAEVDGAIVFVGEYESDSDALVTFSPPITLPTSVSVGDHGAETTDMYVEGVYQGSGTFHWSVVAAGPVTVPAGTFDNSLKLRISLSSAAEEGEARYMWLALGVGVVKEDDTAFGGISWRALTSATVGGVDYPTAGRTFDITDYCDFTDRNEWSYEGVDWSPFYTVNPGHSYGGHEWATVNISVVDGWYYICRTDASGLHYLGTGGGIAGGEVGRFDPPLLIENGLSPGETRAQPTDVYYYGELLGGGSLSYTFQGIEAVATEAGLFSDCMKFELTLAIAERPTSSATMYFARSVGPVAGDDSGPPYSFNAPLGSLTQATIDGRSYPPGDTLYDIADYYPLNMGDQWAVEFLGEGSYGAAIKVIDGTQFLTGLDIDDTVYTMSWYGSEGYDGAELVAPRPDGVALYGFVDPSEGPMVAKPPLVLPNGSIVGDSGVGSGTLYAWLIDHWESVGTLNAEWQLLNAGAVSTPAGYFPDCILVRWAVDVAEEEHMVSYSWLARDLGPVRQYEVGGQDWDELMGATILGATTPDTIPGIAPVTAFVDEGTAVGFDFSAGTNVAQPDDQDLNYLYVDPSLASIHSFDPTGVSRYIGHGEYDFEAIQTYSTFLPPGWDIWGKAWWSEGIVLGSGWSALEETVVVKTREGRYALVHIVDATPTQLEIEYVYPYGWFDW
jgi:hypothetical protein